jgi:L-rhamnose mutarotase
MDRISFVMRVKDGFQNEYIQRHRDVWPEVLAEHQRAGITKMAIYIKGAELFLYMEVENYARAVRILSSSAAVLRWEEYMAPIMESSDADGFDPANAYPDSMPEVFFWESSAGTDGAANSNGKSDISHAPPIPHVFGARKNSVIP